MASAPTVTLTRPRIGRERRNGARVVVEERSFPVRGFPNRVGGSNMRTKPILALLAGVSLGLAPSATFGAPGHARPSSGDISPTATTGQPGVECDDGTPPGNSGEEHGNTLVNGSPFGEAPVFPEAIMLANSLVSTTRTRPRCRSTTSPASGAPIGRSSQAKRPAATSGRASPSPRASPIESRSARKCRCGPRPRSCGRRPVEERPC